MNSNFFSIWKNSDLRFCCSNYILMNFFIRTNEEVLTAYMKIQMRKFFNFLNELIRSMEYDKLIINFKKYIIWMEIRNIYFPWSIDSLKKNFEPPKKSIFISAFFKGEYQEKSSDQLQLHFLKFTSALFILELK